MEETGREVFRAIAEARSAWAEHLTNGNTIHSQTETARVVGIITGLDNLLEFEVSNE
jgi:hypothetical protein